MGDSSWNTWKKINTAACSLLDTRVAVSEGNSIFVYSVSIRYDT